MPRYRITTLVDITRTNPTRTDTDEKKLSQQSNFNSLLQAIGMRSNVSWKKDPVKHEGRLPDPFNGRASHWIWEFEVEQEQVFETEDDPVGLLKDDIDSVPIIPGLEDTVEIDPAVFWTRGDRCNISIEII
jgi:hypothetical protein